FHGVVPVFAVAASPRHVAGPQAPQQGDRVRADRVDRREGRLEWVRVVVERDGPHVLVVADDQGLLLGQDVAQASVRVDLAVGAVDDDFVRRPLAGRRAPLHRGGGDLRERGAQDRRAGGVTVDEGLRVRVGHGTGRSATGTLLTTNFLD